MRYNTHVDQGEAFKNNTRATRLQAHEVTPKCIANAPLHVDKLSVVGKVHWDCCDFSSRTGKVLWKYKYSYDLFVLSEKCAAYINS